MSESPTNIANYYNGWENYQGLLIKAIEPLTAEQLSLRAAPHLRSIGENLLHIIGARARWFHRCMGEGGDDIAAMTLWDRKESQTRSAAELVDGLNQSMQLIQQLLARLPTRRPGVCLQRHQSPLWRLRFVAPVGYLARHRTRLALWR